MGDTRPGASIPRIDAPEIEDQPGFPTWLRDAMTGYLQVVVEVARPYDVAGR